MPGDFVTELWLHLWVNAGFTTIPERVQVFDFTPDQVVVNCTDQTGGRIIFGDDSLSLHLQQLDTIHLCKKSIEAKYGANCNAAE